MNRMPLLQSAIVSLLFIAVAHAQAPRSIWLWEAQAYRMLEDTAYRDASLDFLSAVGIDTIYLYADAYDDGSGLRNILTDTPAAYRSLISEIHTRGQQVNALLGSAPLNTPAYIFPQNSTIAEAMFNNVLQYNMTPGISQQERFDGVNVDIEPYLLPGWNTAPAGMTLSQSRTTIAAQYLDLSDKYRQMKEQYLNDIGETDPSNFVFGPSTPFWFDSNLFDTGSNIDWGSEGSKPLYQHVLDIHDYITIMDYRDFALGTDGIVFHAEHELDYAEDIGKPVVIGVETGPSTPEKVTFLQEGPQWLEEQLALAEDEFNARWPNLANQPIVFDGFAIHDYLGYQRLIGSGPDVIPEPATLSLLAVGLSWLGTLRMRGR